MSTQIPNPNLKELFHSVGEQLSFNKQSGMLHFEYPLPIPAGRNGFTPQFNLSYTQGASNSIWGRGWNGSSMKVNRTSQKKLPTYEKDQQEATFAISGIGEVLPSLNEAGLPIVEKEGEFLIHFYRSKTSGNTSRIRYYTHENGLETYWKIISSDNTTYFFGQYESSRITNPKDATKVYEWLVDQYYTDKGDVIVFEYKAENLDRVNLDLSYEHARKEHLNQKYLKSIFYGNTIPYEATRGWERNNEWLFEVLFDYGEQVLDGQIYHQEQQLWEAREDAYSFYHAGFEIRSYRHCQQVLFFNHINKKEGEPPLLTGSVLLNKALKSGVYELNELIYTGYQQDVDGNYQSKEIPPITFTYSDSYSKEALEIAPVETLNIPDIPHAIDGVKFTWEDLYQDGINGILVEYPKAWYYKPNLGKGQFGPLELVGNKPSMTENGGYQLMDWDGNGQLDCVVMVNGQVGYYEQDLEQKTWSSFQSFEQVPQSLGAVLQLDMDGEGWLDLLEIKGNQEAIWYNSKGKEGYEKPQWIALPAGLPTIRPYSKESKFTLADMTGDGLQDLVWIQNSSIVYWPHKGYGNFGDQVAMEGDLSFDTLSEFDANKIILVDLDGTGTTDIIYLDKNTIKVYYNHSGNSFEYQYQLDTFCPSLTNYDMITVMDVLGNGVRSLVWSTFLPGQTSTTLQYVPLSKQPVHLLTEVNNNLGRSSRVEYTSSLAFSLEASQSGKPWHSKLANHPLVVQQIKEIDHIGQTNLTRKFKYRDGYYDGKERSFMGFAYVEEYDSESFENYTNLPTEDYVIPVLIKSWFYNGLLVNNQAYQNVFFDFDSLAPQLKLPAIKDTSGTLVMTDWKDQEEAYLALTGQLRREEIYEKGAVEILLSVTEHGHEVCYYQARQSGVHAAVLGVLKTESIHYLCEKEAPLSAARIDHQINLAFNEYGETIASCQINYGARNNLAYPEQKITECIYTQLELLQEDKNSAHLMLNIPLETTTYEIKGLDNLYDGTVLLTIEAVRNYIENALINNESESPSRLANLFSKEKYYYTNLDKNEALREGEVSLPLLLHHSKKIAFSESWALDTWQSKVEKKDLEILGYQDSEGYYWMPSDQQEYYDKAAFYTPKSTHHALGGTSTYEYDPSLWLMPTKLISPLGMETQLFYDYGTLNLIKQVDENDNVTEYAYDPLGNLIALSMYGTELDQNGQLVAKGQTTLEGKNVAIPDMLDNLLANPSLYLQGATAYTYYDLWAWTNAQAPLSITSIQQTQENADSNQSEAFQISIGYIDGFGRNLQSKLLVEGGKALKVETDGTVSEVAATQRWVTTGRVLYNNKQLPIKQYEPFYSSNWKYESEEVLDNWGESTHYFYDALGQNIRTVQAQGTFSKVVYSPWKQIAYDAADTLKDSLYYTINSSLPSNHPTQKMLAASASFYDTPVVAHLDTLGRNFLIEEKDEHNVLLKTHSYFDALGNTTKVIDARGIVIHETTYDLLGQVCYSNQADKGGRWTLYNIIGASTDSWDARGFHIKKQYDLLNRLSAVYVDGNNLANLTQRYYYGNHLDIQEAKAKNAIGQLIQVEDSAGVKRLKRYSFKGQLLEQEQQIRTAYEEEVNWAETVGLEAKIYKSYYAYDALGRLLTHEKPDGTIHRPDYHQSGRLKGLMVTGIGNNPQSSHQFIQGSTFNARGQLTELEYGNGIKLRYEYDAKQFQLKEFKAIHQQTDGSHRHLQWNKYTHDVVGNIIRLEDHALGSLLGHASPQVMVKNYAYDALYRLKFATGKIHQSFTQWDGLRNKHSGSIAFKGTQHLHSNNSQAVEYYERSYQYDVSGNLTKMRHSGSTRSWTRNMWVSEKSNRSIAATNSNNVLISDPENYFDTAGNFIKMAHLRAMHWDYLGQLSQVVLIERANEPKDAEYYVYHSSGMRSRKVTERKGANGQIEITEKIYLDGCELTQKRIKGATQIRYKAFTTQVNSESNSRIALIHYVEIGSVDQESSVRIRYQVGNHLGSVALEVDEQGQIISYEEYFPFGGTAFLFGNNKKEVAWKTYRYSGKEKDDATGLYYYGFRYYVPWLCRWLSADPGGLRDGTNLYAFVQNNPINLVDAWGLESVSISAEKANAMPREELPIYVTDASSYRTYLKSFGLGIYGDIDPKTYSLLPGASIYVDNQDKFDRFMESRQKLRALEQGLLGLGEEIERIKNTESTSSGGEGDAATDESSETEEGDTSIGNNAEEGAHNLDETLIGGSGSGEEGEGSSDNLKHGEGAGESASDNKKIGKGNEETGGGVNEGKGASTGGKGKGGGKKKGKGNGTSTSGKPNSNTTSGNENGSVYGDSRGDRETDNLYEENTSNYNTQYESAVQEVDNYDWAVVGKEVAVGAAAAIGIGLGMGALVAAGVLSGGLAVAVGLGMAAVFGFVSYAIRSETAKESGIEVSKSSLIGASVLESIGLLPMVEAYTEKDYVTGRKLTNKEQSQRFGQSIVGWGAYLFGAGMAARGRGTNGGRPNKPSSGNLKEKITQAKGALKGYDFKGKVNQRLDDIGKKMFGGFMDEFGPSLEFAGGPSLKGGPKKVPKSPKKGGDIWYAHRKKAKSAIDKYIEKARLAKSTRRAATATVTRGTTPVDEMVRILKEAGNNHGNTSLVRIGNSFRIGGGEMATLSKREVVDLTNKLLGNNYRKKNLLEALETAKREGVGHNRAASLYPVGQTADTALVRIRMNTDNTDAVFVMFHYEVRKGASTFKQIDKMPEESKRSNLYKANYHAIMNLKRLF